MPIFKTLEETYLNGDTLYNFGGYAPGILFPTPVPYNPPFCIGDGFSYTSIATQTFAITESQDGGYFVCGGFNWYKNYRSNGVVKITSNGDVDETFISPLSANTFTGALGNGASIIKPSTFFPSKYYLAGNFNYNNSSIIRLNSDGSVDNTFNVVIAVSSTTNSFVELSGGSIIMIGIFTTINGVSRIRVAKINSDGTLDTTFVVGTGFNGNPYDILLSPDEQSVFISGAFTQYSGVSKNRIIKLNTTTGAIDPTFTSSFDNVVREMTFDGNGNLWVCGAFTNGPGAPSNNISFINCLDTISGQTISGITQNFGGGFNPNNIFGIGYDAVNDRIICINQFANENYLNHPTYFYYGRICAIHASTGLFDTTFGSSTDSNYGFSLSNVGTDTGDDILVDTNGNILLTGYFNSFNGDRYDKIIRLDQNGQSNTTTSC